MVFQIQGFSPNALRPFTVFVPLNDVKNDDSDKYDSTRFEFSVHKIFI